MLEQFRFAPIEGYLFFVKYNERGWFDNVRLMCEQFLCFVRVMCAALCHLIRSPLAIFLKNLVQGMLRMDPQPVNQ